MGWLRSSGRAGASFLARARRYTSHLTAAAGILIVILSVYLVQQGRLVPGPVSPEPSLEQTGSASTSTEIPGGSASVPAAVSPTETGASQASGGQAAGPEAGGPPSPDQPVIETEGSGTQAPGPLSRGDCLQALRPPASGTVVRGFGIEYLSAAFGDWRYHTGVDIALETGDDIRAALAGTVTGIGRDPAGGLRVEVSHGFGLVTVYGDLGEALVTVGQEVVAGQPLGSAGAPGQAEADLGVHLHYEIRVDGRVVDPGPYVGS